MPRIQISQQEYELLCQEISEWLSDLARVSLPRRLVEGGLTKEELERAINGEFVNLTVSYEIKTISNDIRLMLGRIRGRLDPKSNKRQRWHNMKNAIVHQFHSVNFSGTEKVQSTINKELEHDIQQ